MPKRCKLERYSLILIACIGMLCVSMTSLHAASINSARQHELIYLLKQDCGSCHGLTLQGGLGPALTPAELAGKTKAAMIATILQGRPGTPMPPWSDQLTFEEVSWLVDQLYQGVK